MGVRLGFLLKLRVDARGDRIDGDEDAVTVGLLAVLGALEGQVVVGHELCPLVELDVEHVAARGGVEGEHTVQEAVEGPQRVLDATELGGDRRLRICRRRFDRASARAARRA